MSNLFCIHYYPIQTPYLYASSQRVLVAQIQVRLQLYSTLLLRLTNCFFVFE